MSTARTGIRSLGRRAMLGVYPGSLEEQMVRRPNISLLERTVDLIYRVSGERRCRELVDRAVARFLRHGSRARIRKQLAAGARARAVRDLQLAEEWFALSDQQGP